MLDFKDEKIDLYIEVGPMGGDLSSYVRYRAGIERKVKINGREATAVMADLNKITGNPAANVDGTTRFETFEKNRVLGVYFPEEFATFVIRTSDEDSLKTGKTILQSIRFK